MKTKLLTIGSAALAALTSTAFSHPDGEAERKRPNPEEIIVEIVADYDANADNLIDATELEAALVGLHEKRMAKMKEFAEERGIDTDRHREEREHSKPAPAVGAARLLERFDQDGNEALDTEELNGVVKAIQTMGPLGKRGPGHGPRHPRTR